MVRTQWRSQYGFLMAAVSSAVGLGNIWRFSYLAYEYGGGAFLIPYCIALLTAGIPLLILEYGIGHQTRGSAPLAFRTIARKWEGLGWWPTIFAMFGVAVYYSVIVAWCLNYFIFSFDLTWGENTNAFFFKDYLRLSQSPFDLGSVQPEIAFSVFVIWSINWFIVYRGIQKGIEAACKIFMPLLLLLTLMLVVWAAQLEGAWLGIEAYITPDFSKLDNLDVWVDAYTQIFFTLSLGFGIMIVYASYLPEQSNISGHAIRVALINCGFSIISGFGVFSVLGFMAQSQGKAIADVATESIGLAFVVYPKAISLMPAGKLFGVLFFLCLTIAGISSLVSIIEAFVSSMVDKFQYRRAKLASVLAVTGCLGSLVFCTQAGLLWVDILDHFITHYGLITVGILECVLLAWVYQLKEMQAHINQISRIQVGAGWFFSIRWFVPGLLALMLLGYIWEGFFHPYGGYNALALVLIGRDWLLAALITALFVAGRPWKKSQDAIFVEQLQTNAAQKE